MTDTKDTLRDYYENECYVEQCSMATYSDLDNEQLEVIRNSYGYACYNVRHHADELKGEMSKWVKRMLTNSRD